jgi:hypothetical protein
VSPEVYFLDHDKLKKGNEGDSEAKKTRKKQLLLGEILC